MTDTTTQALCGKVFQDGGRERKRRNFDPAYNIPGSTIVGSRCRLPDRMGEVRIFSCLNAQEETRTDTEKTDDPKQTLGIGKGTHSYSRRDIPVMDRDRRCERNRRRMTAAAREQSPTSQIRGT